MAMCRFHARKMTYAGLPEPAAHRKLLLLRPLFRVTRATISDFWSIHHCLCWAASSHGPLPMAYCRPWLRRRVPKELRLNVGSPSACGRVATLSPSFATMRSATSASPLCAAWAPEACHHSARTTLDSIQAGSLLVDRPPPWGGAEHARKAPHKGPQRLLLVLELLALPLDLLHIVLAAECATLPPRPTSTPRPCIILQRTLRVPAPELPNTRERWRERPSEVSLPSWGMIAKGWDAEVRFALPNFACHPGAAEPIWPGATHHSRLPNGEGERGSGQVISARHNVAEHKGRAHTRRSIRPLCPSPRLRL